MAPTPITEPRLAASTGPIYLSWAPVVAGAIVASAVSFLMISFAAGMGLAVASPSASWRDTSATLAIVGGIWLLLTSLASFGLGGYLAGRMRAPWGDTTSDAVEFRDGVHGLLVWALAILIGAVLAFATAPKTVPGRADAPAATSVEPLIALELDRLFRSDKAPADRSADLALRAEAARILATGAGHSGMQADDRAYLVRLVEARTGLAQPDAEARVNQVSGEARDAISRARSSAVILAFMIAAALLIGVPAAWMAAAAGGEHRDGSIHHTFWRRWEVDRGFIIR